MKTYLLGLSLLVIALGTAQGLDYLSGGEAYLDGLRTVMMAQGVETILPTMVAPSAPMDASGQANMMKPEPPPSVSSDGMVQPMPIVEPSKPMPVPEPGKGEPGKPMPMPPPNMNRPMESQPQMPNFSEEDRQIYISPQELQQVAREMNDLKRQIKQASVQLKKLPALANDLARLTTIGQEIDKYLAQVKDPAFPVADKQDVIQEFRDNQYWDEMNKIRMKVEMPREIKQWTQSLTKVEKLLKTKAVQNLGLKFDLAMQAISDAKQALQVIQQQLASGNVDEAAEAFQALREEQWHPGDIESVIYRYRDIKTKLKQVKDANIRAQVEEAMQEAIDAFNAGDFRDASQALNEYGHQIMRLIDQFVWAQARKRAFTNEDSNKLQALEEMIKNRLEGQGNGGMMEKQAMPVKQ